MTAPSEAQFIDLENWAIKLRDRFDRANVDEDELDGLAWAKRYPEMPWNRLERERLYETLRSVIDLARGYTPPFDERLDGEFIKIQQRYPLKGEAEQLAAVEASR